MVSKAEKMLVAVFRTWPSTEFTAEDLVVACWKHYPEEFGLQGYQNQHPDSNIVYRYIMGQSSIVKKDKWLHQVGIKLYRISNIGADYALELLGSDGVDLDGQQTHRLRIDRAREVIFSRLMSSRAWHKFQSGGEIVFREACAFWGITPRSSREDYERSRQEVDSALAMGTRRLQMSGASVVYLADHRLELTPGALEQLHELDSYLETKFAGELAAIRMRLVERGRVRPAKI